MARNKQTNLKCYMNAVTTDTTWQQAAHAISQLLNNSHTKKLNS